MTKRTPENTKASPDQPSTETTQTVTKLAEVNDPAKITKADIDEIAADDGSDKPENSANADAAETLRQAKKDAKKSDEDKPSPYFAGQGGAVDL